VTIRFPDLSLRLRGNTHNHITRGNRMGRERSKGIEKLTGKRGRLSSLARAKSGFGKKGYQITGYFWRTNGLRVQTKHHQ